MTSSSKRTRRAKPGSEILVGERTDLRPVTDEDLPSLQEWDEDPAIVALMGRRFGDKTVQEWYQSVKSGQNARAWVIMTKEERLIGELELAHLNWRTSTAELRVCIGEKDCWSMGYGTDAIRAALRCAFESFELGEVYLRVFVSNARAVRVYERIGFRKKAILEASARREDPSAVLLMTISRERWARLLAREVQQVG